MVQNFTAVKHVNMDTVCPWKCYGWPDSDDLLIGLFGALPNTKEMLLL
jgi:hypothetical protein